MPSYHRPALSHDVLAEVCRPATAAIAVLCVLLAIFRLVQSALFFGFSRLFFLPTELFGFFYLMYSRWYV